MKTYDELIADIKKKLDTTIFAVLATSDKEGNITASQMRLVSNGLTVYLQTDASFEKVKNIKENPKIALNLGCYYFKGTAKIIGHPTTEKRFVEILKSQHLSAYESYTNLPNEVLIKIELNEARIWAVDKTKPESKEETVTVNDLKTKNIRTITCDKIVKGE